MLILTNLLYNIQIKVFFIHKYSYTFKKKKNLIRSNEV